MFWCSGVYSRLLLAQCTNQSSHFIEEDTFVDHYLISITVQFTLTQPGANVSTMWRTDWVEITYRSIPYSSLSKTGGQKYQSKSHHSGECEYRAMEYKPRFYRPPWLTVCANLLTRKELCRYYFSWIFQFRSVQNRHLD